jgi:hypothetical protein
VNYAMTIQVLAGTTRQRATELALHGLALELRHERLCPDGSPRVSFADTGGEWMTVNVTAPVRRRNRTVECGTDGGYYHHRRALGEPACSPCKAAHAEAQALRSMRRRLQAAMEETR